MPVSAMEEGLAALLMPTLSPRLSFAESGHPNAGVIRIPPGIREYNSKVASIFREASWFSQTVKMEELGQEGNEMRLSQQNHPPNSSLIP